MSAAGSETQVRNTENRRSNFKYTNRILQPKLTQKQLQYMQSYATELKNSEGDLLSLTLLRPDSESLQECGSVDTNVSLHMFNGPVQGLV